MKLFKRKNKNNNFQVTYIDHCDNDKIVTEIMDSIAYNNFEVYEYIGSYTILEVKKI